MICGQCGAKINDNCEFCPECGASLVLDEDASTISVACISCGAKIPMYNQYCPECGAQQYKRKKPHSGSGSTGGKEIPPMPPLDPVPDPGGIVVQKSRKKVGLIVGLVAALLLILAGLQAYYYYFMLTPIDLNDYVKTTSLKGTNGSGIATMVFDEDKFYKDWKGKIKYSGNLDSIKDESLRYEDGAVIFYTACVHGNFDKSTNLSNGDVITFKWRFDDKNGRVSYHLRVLHDDYKSTVSGLKDP